MDDEASAVAAAAALAPVEALAISLQGATSLGDLCTLLSLHAASPDARAASRAAEDGGGGKEGNRLLAALETGGAEGGGTAAFEGRGSGAVVAVCGAVLAHVDGLLESRGRLLWALVRGHVWQMTTDFMCKVWASHALASSRPTSHDLASARPISPDLGRWRPSAR